MNRKTLLILVVLVVVLGGAGLVTYKRSSSAWRQESSVAGGKVLAEFPLNDVSGVVIKDAGKELNLVKQNDKWGVKERAGYPADFDQVSKLIRTLWDLKAVQDVKIGPSQLARMELIEPAKDAKDTGMLVDLQDKNGKRIAALLIGKKFVRSSPGMPGEGFPAGRYVMPLDGKTRVALVSESFSDVETKPENWIDKTFIRVERIKSVALAGTTPAMNWKLQRENETAQWKLADANANESVDSSKLPAFPSTLGSMNLLDVLTPDTKPESVGLDKPSIITAETFDNFTYTIRAGKVTDDKFPITVSVSAAIEMERKPPAGEKPEDKKRIDDEFSAKRKTLDEKLAREKLLENRIFLVAKYSIKSLLKDRASFLSAPQPTASPAPSAAGVSVTTPPVSAAEAVTKPVAVPTAAKKKKVK